MIDYIKLYEENSYNPLFLYFIVGIVTGQLLRKLYTWPFAVLFFWLRLL